MASPADEALPVLPPIKTASLPRPPSASASSPASPFPAPAAGDSAKDAEPSTPTSEESRLRKPAVCPPAPRRPLSPPRLPAPKRKLAPSPVRVFVTVPRDLSTVFRSLSPKKRIRVL